MSEPVPTDAGRGRRTLLLAVPLTVLAVGNVVWFATQRVGRPYSIDEAGYSAIALRDLAGLQSGGVAGWWHAIDAQPIHAPLLPALTSLLHWALGVRVWHGILVSTVAYALLIGLALVYTARWRTVSRVVAVVLVAAAPELLLYSRTMNFSELASAAVAGALVAQQRSRQFSRWSGSLAWGACIGLMLLARTMTIAFLPALVLGALLLAGQTGWRGRLLRIVSGLAVALLVASAWYWTNWHGVWTYLTSYGYGSQSGSYGSHRDLLSAGDWYSWLAQRANDSLWMGMTLVVGLGLLATTVYAVRQLARVLSAPHPERPGAARRLWLRCVRSDVLAPAVVATGGIAALSTTANLGTAFLAPLLLPLSLTAGWGLGHVSRALGARGRAARVVGSAPVMIGAVALLVVPGAVVTFLPFTDLAVAEVALPAEQRMTVWNSRPILRIDVENAHMPASSVTDPATARDWASTNTWLEHVMLASVTAPGQRPLLVLTDRHPLVNVNSLALEALRSNDTSSVITWIDPLLGTYDVGALVGQTRSYREYVTVVVTMTPGADEFLPVVPDAVGERLVSGLHLREAGSRVLPDGRVLTVWVRPQAVAAVEAA